MRIILPLFLFVILFIFGCSKAEPEVTTQVIKIVNPEEIGVREVDEEIEEEVEEDIVTVKLCHDTDNGIVRWVNGSIFGFHDNAERFEYKDFCFDNNFLIEFYCENEMPQNASFLCDNGCEDNHCL